MMKKNYKYIIGNSERKEFTGFLARYGNYQLPLPFPRYHGSELLHTTKQLNKISKKGLIRLVVKLEDIIVKVAWQMYKSKLPRLKTIRQKSLPKRKTKRKFSKKQLAAQRLFAKRARAGTLRKRRR